MAGPETGTSRPLPATAPDEQSVVGSGYVFDEAGSSWTEIEKLVSSDALITDQFGGGITVMRRGALIGAPWHIHDLTQDGVACA